jgi:hypothetical protein
MGPIRSARTACLLAALVLAAAGCGSGGDAGAPAPAGEQAATTTSAAGTRQGAASGTGQTAGAAEGERAARAFMRDLGMPEPASGRFRSTGPASGEVTVHPAKGEGGRPLDGPGTLVRLHRYTGGWVVTGTSAADIRVAQPIRFARIASPVTVRGRASAFEGTVQVAVTEDRQGADRVLGRGFVTGSGTAELGPFSGRIAFGAPSAGAGWLIFRSESAAGGGGVLEATAVRIRFAAAS